MRGRDDAHNPADDLRQPSARCSPGVPGGRRPTVLPVSVSERGRATASISQPLDAEVLVDGAWWPGAVLGWRHDEGGGCEAEVRLVLAGREQVRWTALAEVRLPEAGAVPAADAVTTGRPESSAPVAETVMMSRVELRGLLAASVPGRDPGGQRRHASDLTAELPVVRCPDAEAAAGRHRAPAAGRHRADTAASPVPEPDLLTRPIRLDDVSAWSWSDSPAAAR